MKNLVIYHSADFDGLFSREVARLHFKDTAAYVGWNYGDPPIPVPKNDGEIYIIDLSPECLLPSDFMEFSDRVVWIDHHKSAIDKWPSHLRGYRIDGVAACRLAMQWFRFLAKTIDALPEKEDFVNRNVCEPFALRLAGEYDIWDKRDPNAELFQHGMRSQPLDDSWEILLQHGYTAECFVHSLLTAGKSLQYARSKENESVIKELGFTFEWEGLKFLGCNHGRFNSHLFTAGLTPEHDACFGFKWDGKSWNVSLYHAPGKEHHDLSKIAIKHGGGGHRGACGFRTKTLPFNL